jgi:nucleoside-diphosphate kinase
VKGPGGKGQERGDDDEGAHGDDLEDGSRRTVRDRPRHAPHRLPRRGGRRYKPARTPHPSPDPAELSMATERTLSIIKPDATERNLTGQINARFEAAGLRIVAQKRLRLTKAEAEAFYAVHKERPFYGDLVAFMTSGPVVVQVLEGEDAIAKNREVMGATDPAKAEAGTIRKDFAQNIEANSVHGSDAPETATQEIAFFFAEIDIVG